MKEYLRKIKCDCGNIFEIFGNTQYKCKCEKTWIKDNGYWLENYCIDGHGQNFTVLSCEEYISDDSGLIDAAVINLYKKCKEKAERLGFTWSELTTKNRKSGQKIITYISATHYILLKNGIEANNIDFSLRIDENKHDEYLSRFNNFLIVLEELEKGELNFSDRTQKEKESKSAFQIIEEKYEKFTFAAISEKLNYTDITFHV